MNIIKNIKLSLFYITAIAFVSAAIISGCTETPIGQIVPYSGNWKFAFYNESGVAYADANITIQDTGDFCGELNISGSGTSFYIKGDVDYNGNISGGFANNCSANSTGFLLGNFTEILGAVLASGTFSDTIHNPSYKGTWQAKRN